MEGLGQGVEATQLTSVTTAVTLTESKTAYKHGTTEVFICFRSYSVY